MRGNWAGAVLSDVISDTGKTGTEIVGVRVAPLCLMSCLDCVREYKEKLLLSDYRR